jgi:hypothetical protein
MIKDLIKLADNLDMSGYTEESEIIDSLLPYIKKYLEDDGFKASDKGEHNEDYMFEYQLDSISEKASKIKKILQSGHPLEDWVETYIAQADLMMDNIYDKLSSGSYNDENLPCGCRGSCCCE